jgi:DNA-binding GntR family transcriptional regulator
MSLPSDAYLGTAKTLCQELKVGKWAMRHGLQLLRDEKVVRTVPGRGSFVFGPHPVNTQTVS